MNLGFILQNGTLATVLEILLDQGHESIRVRHFGSPARPYF